MLENIDGIACVIYAAKSTEDRRGSIPGQISECRAAIDAEPGRSIVGEYTDEAFSAFRRNRGPGLAEAMQHTEDLAEERGTAELWVQHSDRVARGDGRSARHTVEIALWALKRDVKVRTIQDPDTFRDLLYAVVTGQRNHEDSRRKGLASVAGRRRAAARGDFIGYKPDGYRLAITIDDHGFVTKRMEIDPDRRPAIEMIFRMALAGKRPGAIASSLNTAGWQTKPFFRGGTPSSWRAGRIMDVLRNPRYAALAVFDGEMVARGHWPAYLTERQHTRIREELDKGRPTKKPRQRETYLLARLATCGRCGSRMYALTGQLRADGTFARRYMCANHRSHHDTRRCQATCVEADLLEAMLVANLRVLLFDELSLIVTGDGQRVDAMLKRMIAVTESSAPAVRRASGLRHRARDLGAVARLESWAEQERVGRTDASRKEARQLNRVLRDWFIEIAITTSETTVQLVVHRRPTARTPVSTRTEVCVGLHEWAHYAPLARRGGRRYRAWNKPEITGALQAWAELHNRNPTWSDLSNAHGDYPSSTIILRHFGTWKCALHKADLNAKDHTQCARTRAWDDVAVIQALVSWTDEHGSLPI
jgi:hypothetical protein